MMRMRTAVLIALLAGLAAVVPLILAGGGIGDRLDLAVPASLAAAAENPPPSGEAPGLNGVDFSGLTPEQAATAIQILNETRCNCGRGLTLAECRVKDPSCTRSLALSRGVVQDLKDGKDRPTVQKNLAASLARLAAPAPPAATRPQEDLNKVYRIDTVGAPYKGPKGARVVIVEFSDYQ